MFRPVDHFRRTNTCCYLTEYASVRIILSLQHNIAGNFRVPIVRSFNSLRTKDSPTWWHLKLFQLTLAIQCPDWLRSLVMENLFGEGFPAWHSSPRHSTTHTSNAQNSTLVQAMFLNPSPGEWELNLITASFPLRQFHFICHPMWGLSAFIRLLMMTICVVPSRPKICLLLTLYRRFKRLYLITGIVHVAVLLLFREK